MLALAPLAVSILLFHLEFLDGHRRVRGRIHRGGLGSPCLRYHCTSRLKSGSPPIPPELGSYPSLDVSSDTLTEVRRWH